MKKNSLLFTCFILIINQNAFSQSTYDDVIRLAPYVQPSGTALKFDALPGPLNDGYISILKKYIPEAKREAIKNNADLYKYFSNSNNSFLVDYFSDGTPSSSTDPGVSTEKSIIQSIDGLNVTTIADGVAQFLVERANEELNVMFFDNFKSVLETEKEIQALFPTTSDLLINSEPYQYGQLIGVLQSSFRRDIQSLVLNLENFAQIVINEEINLTNRQKTQLLLGARLARTVKEITQGTSLIDVFESFPDTYLTDDQKENNVYSTLKTASVLSQSIRSDRSEEIYIKFDDFKSDILEDEVTRKIFLGLLYEKLNGIEFYDTGKNPITAKEVLEQIYKDYDYFANYYFQLISISEEFTSKTKELLSDLDEIPDSAKYLRYYQLFDLGVDLIDKGFDFDNLLKPLIQPDGSNSEIIKTFYEDKEGLVKVLRSGNEIYKSLNEQDYFSTFTQSISIYQTITKCGSYKEKGCHPIEISDKIIKYGTFMVNLAEADSPEEVKAAISSAALPTGSSIMKESTDVGIFLNSYLGGSYYRENVRDVEGGSPGGRFDTFGIHAPIGPELSLDYNWVLKKYIGSFSVFLPIVDLGALTAFRIDDNNSEIDVPKITLDNILVFGVYGVIKIKKAPISIGAGIQKGPQLREIGTEEIMVLDAMNNPSTETIAVLSEVNWAFKAFISVDIPIFKLYAKPRR